MGVPGFFRWLSRKYPSIVVDANEERRDEVDGEDKTPIDCTQPNLNFQEFDNLYLDMNGIIHSCTHPEDRPAPKTEEEIFALIFEQVDHLFSIVRPRKLLYMAIDGVAPRAKMNQQRSRRFRASKEAADKREEIARIRKMLEDQGIPLPMNKPHEEGQHFDSNCITPGTPFMARLSEAFRRYIRQRIAHNPAWQKIQVILSDSSVSGEGEHKIMEYIRRQRASPGHDPNTAHCLCGPDADLIMLGLATHEANFTIIREQFIPNQTSKSACELCGQVGHELKRCKGLPTSTTITEKEPSTHCQMDDRPLKEEKTKRNNLLFVRLPVLREYLERDLSWPTLPFPFDLERAIDDWVMMCSLVGNDFLPHLPSLEIWESAIDRLVQLYKTMLHLPTTTGGGGWLTTEGGDICLERLKMIMSELGKVEYQIFKDRQLQDLKFKESRKTQRALEKRAKAKLIALETLNNTNNNHQNHQQQNFIGETHNGIATEEHVQPKRNIPLGTKRKASWTPPFENANANGASTAKSFRHNSLEGHDENKPTLQKVPNPPIEKSTPVEKSDESDEEKPLAPDTIRLWETGWKNRYYRTNFQVSVGDREFRRELACAYAQGLCWMHKYYCQGCASWSWFYPYHYAPFASDFYLIGDFQPDFNQPTKPFKPFEQQMGVFPAASSSNLPEGWRWLMSEPQSPIIDFYPEKFEIDLAGKKFASQGVALLPFVDEKRLLDAIGNVYATLTEEERERNVVGQDRLFVGKCHGLFKMIRGIHQERKKNANGNMPAIEEEKWVIIGDGSGAFGISGQIAYDDDTNAATFENGTLPPSILAQKGSNEIENDNNYSSCVMVQFRNPQFPPYFRFKTARLDGTVEASRVLKPRENFQ